MHFKAFLEIALLQGMYKVCHCRWTDVRRYGDYAVGAFGHELAGVVVVAGKDSESLRAAFQNLFNLADIP